MKAMGAKCKDFLRIVKKTLRSKGLQTEDSCRKRGRKHRNCVEAVTFELEKFQKWKALDSGKITNAGKHTV